MRVNVYAEEMTDRVEIISKTIDGYTFLGVRFYLELPTTVPNVGALNLQDTRDPSIKRVVMGKDDPGMNLQGPFMHRPGDDDSAAVTFWGKRDLRAVLRKALDLLDAHYSADRKEKMTSPQPVPPKIVCLCGSTKFKDEFIAANKSFTLKGKIVLTVDFFMHAGDGVLTLEEKVALDELHLRKIDLADEVFFLNVGGYIGESTRRELAYAIAAGRRNFDFLDRAAGKRFMSEHRDELGALIRKFGGYGRDQYHCWPHTTPSDCGEPGRGIPG